MKTVFVIAFVILSFGICSANPGDSVREVIKRLHAKGIYQIGDFDTHTFLKQLDNVKWKTVKSLPPNSIAGTRRSAYFIKPNKTIYLTEDLSVGAELLKLHEALGVLGYNDEKYALSASIQILLNVDGDDLPKLLQQQYGKTYFKKDSLFQTGGSSVGGGGDGEALVLKMEILDEILLTETYVDRQFLLDYPQVVFEPIGDKKSDKFNGIFEYKIKVINNAANYGMIEGVRRDRFFQEAITIYYPEMDRSTPEGKSLFEYTKAKVKEMILGIYPLNEAEGTVSMTPKECLAGSNKSDIKYRKTESKNLMAIQLIRSMTILECFPSKEPSNVTATLDW